MGQNCRKCGAPLEPEASFCTVCGAAVHDRQESGISDASKAKKRKKAGIIMGCLAGSAAVIVLLAVVLIGRPWDKKAVLESSPEFVVEMIKRVRFMSKARERMRPGSLAAARHLWRAVQNRKVKMPLLKKTIKQ